MITKAPWPDSSRTGAHASNALSSLPHRLINRVPFHRSTPVPQSQKRAYFLLKPFQPIG